MQQLLAWLERRDWDEGATLMVFGTLIGVASGLGVVGFYRLIDLSHLVLIQLPESHFPRVGQAFYRPLLTAVGLWAAWLVVRRSKIPDGQNVPDVQLAVAKGDGVIRTGPVIVRTIASALTLGSGASAGSEGPVAVLGAGLGSSLGRRLQFQPRHVKILIGCGAAAGIAGAFNAPFAGAFFALEEVLGSFSVGAFSPVVIASVVGALTVRPFLGNHPIFTSRIPASARPLEILLYPLLGVACGLVSAFYSRAYLAAVSAGKRVRGPRWIWPLLAGGVTGLIVIASRGLLAGDGHLAIPESIFGGLAWYILLAIALAKIVATVITLGFGGSGGVFTPTLFIGAALGGGLGVLGTRVLPAGLVHPHAWAFVGMAGMVAGATRAPLTAIFMVFEMTDDYTYVVPLMIVAVIAYTTARRYSKHGLYDGWLAARGEHLAHGVDRSVMDHTHVTDALDREVATVRAGASIDDLVDAAAATRHGVLPVVDDDGAFVGLVSHHVLRDAIVSRGSLDAVVVAADLAEPVEVLAPTDSLRRALAAMNARGLDALPVVETNGGGTRFAGLLSRHDVLVVYERSLARAV
ncbi:MAG: Cl-channel voltage-gated family protein [Gemmatimonadetes bacterium]|nr:Cl-channel voltage-gated family protein [Gemmatimonadota bacterium]